jgi:molybdopterin-guanine dinucleotide biosynthesis protein A
MPSPARQVAAEGVAAGGEVPAGEVPAGEVAAAVLAGGSSRRMGRDKATLRVGGVELARAVIEVAGQVAAPVVVVAPDGHPAVALAARAGAGWVPDPGFGPLAAIAAALGAIEAPYLLVLAADHPELRAELLSLLIAERATGEAVACRRGPRLEPLVAIYQRVPALSAASALLDGGTDRSLRGLLGALRTRVVEEWEWRQVDPAGSSFVDLDDPADLAAFRARAGGEARPNG